MPPDTSDTPDRRCGDCGTKLMVLAQRVDHMEENLHRLNKEADAHKLSVDQRFLGYMEKEERSFKDLYLALKSLEDKVSAIVMTGMEEMATMKELLKDELDSKIAATESKLEAAVSKLVTRKEVVLTWTVAVAVATVMIYVLTNFSMSENENRAVHRLSTKVEQLTTFLEAESASKKPVKP